MSRKRSKKSGLPPGSLVHVGEVNADSPVHISVTRFNSETFSEEAFSEHENEAQCRLIEKSPADEVLWVDVIGIHRPEVIQRIGEQFKLHPLVLEDILNATQRAKREAYDSYLFLVVRLVDYNAKLATLESEQISFILGDKFLLTFQERPTPIFEKVRERLRYKKGKGRTEGPDYLAYSLLDAIVDNYFLDLEALGEVHDSLEQTVIKINAPLAGNTITLIYKLKQTILGLRRAVWPLREILSGLYREEIPQIRPSTKIYLRDVYDHVVEIIDIVETLRETAGSLLDLYLSAVNNRVNEVSKLLTMIATIFLPLTFLTGVYGMNFDHMPELHSHYAYPLLWVVMVGVVVGMLTFFKRKGWW